MSAALFTAPALRQARLAASGGQSLTEFLVLCLALLPLFLLLPMIGKYQDIGHATHMASRYIAFEAGTRNDALNSFKPEAQLATEIRQRFFSNADAPIKTGASANGASQNLLWRDTRDAPLIPHLDPDVTISFGAAAGATHKLAFSAASDGAPFLLAAQLDLPTKGIYTANVDVALANLPAGLKSLQPFDTINLKVQRHTSVVINPWVALSGQNIEEKINQHAIIPGQLVAFVPNVYSAILSLFETDQVAPLHVGELSLWRDVVPADRLPKP